MAKSKPKTGRPPLPINPEHVEQLAAVGLNVNEIGVFLKCSPDILKRRFNRQMENGWDKMRASIKRTQYDVAVNQKNPTMLIWLGKQHLGQSDTAGQREGSIGDQLEGLFKALMAGPAARSKTIPEDDSGEDETVE